MTTNGVLLSGGLGGRGCKVSWCQIFVCSLDLEVHSCLLVAKSLLFFCPRADCSDPKALAVRDRGCAALCHLLFMYATSYLGFCLCT